MAWRLVVAGIDISPIIDYRDYYYSVLGDSRFYWLGHLLFKSEWSLFNFRKRLAEISVSKNQNLFYLLGSTVHCCSPSDGNTCLRF